MNVSKKKIIFVTGHRKSGTSLLLRLFDNHPSATVFPFDFSFFYAYFPFYQIKRKNIKEKKKRIFEICKKHVLDYEKNKKIKLSIIDKKFFFKKILNSINSLNIDSKKHFFEIFINLWFKCIQKENIKNTIIIKETSQSMYYEELLKIFPQMKMINIIREPKNNFSAIKDGLKIHYSKYGETYINILFNTILRIKIDLQYSFLFRDKKSFYNIKYENLVSSPAKEIVKLCKFLNIKFNKKMTIPTILGDKYYGNSYMPKNKNINISKKNINSWKNRISKEEGMAIEFFLNKEIKYFKYDFFFKDRKKVINCYKQMYLNFHYNKLYIDTFNVQK